MLLGSVRALFTHLTPGLVLRGPSDIALFVGELHRRTKLVALIPGNRLERLWFYFGVPQRILIEIVLAQTLIQLLVQADRAPAQGLGS